VPPGAAAAATVSFGCGFFLFDDLRVFMAQSYKCASAEGQRPRGFRCLPRGHLFLSRCRFEGSVKRNRGALWLGTQRVEDRFICWPLVGPRLGKVKIAQVLARPRLHLGVSSVGRMRRQRPTPGWAGLGPAGASGRRLTASYPNRHADLTTVPTSAGFWSSCLPFALQQCWPFHLTYQVSSITVRPC
jgi:hypothetical protein